MIRINWHVQYERWPHLFFYFCLKVYDLLHLCVLSSVLPYLSSSWGNLPLQSQSYWSLSCDHGMHCSDESMWEQQQSLQSGPWLQDRLQYPMPPWSERSTSGGKQIKQKIIHIKQKIIHNNWNKSYTVPQTKIKRWNHRTYVPRYILYVIQIRRTYAQRVAAETETEETT